MTSTPTRRRPRARALVALTAAVLALALAGCSADGSGGADEAGEPAGAGMSRDEAMGGDAGGAADVAQEEPAAAPADRLVAQTGDVTVSAEDPRAAAREVVALVDRHGGRVDDRFERTGSGGDDRGEAVLTVRVPTAAVTAFMDDLADVGTVEQLDLRGEDVTVAARDLDARLAAAELSVDRMTDLLGRATAHDDVIAAERALTDRQESLERLRSEREQLADRVALSTLRVAVHPAAEGRAAQERASSPGTFLDGLRTGWDAFLAVGGTVLVVLGVLLPWLVAGVLVTAAVVAVRRGLRTRRPQPDL